MHGNCHYPNFNARPRSFYVTSTKASSKRQKSKIKRTTVVKRQDMSREEKQLRAELKRMRSMLNQKDEAFDDKMR